MKSLQSRVTGNPENNIVYYTRRNLEISPSMSEHKLHQTKEIFMPRARIELSTRLHFANKLMLMIGRS